MVEYERTLRKMSVGDILDYSLEVYKKDFKKLTLLALIFYVPFMVLYTAVVSYVSGELLNSAEVKGATVFHSFHFLKSFSGLAVFGANGINRYPGSPGEFTYMLLAYYLVLLLVSLVYFAYTITLKPVMDTAIIKIVYADVVYGREQGLKETVREAFKRFPRLVANRLLYGLIVFGAFLGVYILFIVFFVVLLLSSSAWLLSGVFSRPAGPVGNVALAMGISVVVLVVIMAMGLFVAFFALKFGFGLQAVVIENKGAVEGLSRSWRLTGKNFWHILFSSLFGALLFFTVPALLSAGVSVLIEVNKALYTLLATVVQVVASLAYPYLTVLMTMVFINLKIKKEGLDLEVKVDKLLEAQQAEEQKGLELENGE
ncbi:MAG: glycerophosphoryl diester phosphodiesterase membrane domain-containing protein [Clostridiales bacterium]|jgi:hypothetical protein|nr:glycerophosphoryl diester phosphodiesterase membrane domain-containing protein [Eubacteriales bacterium]MDH7565386.1 glycerophosphoryl diester phosphodiesterase membrane domain-containing protein [Clostridiales bacterium]